MLNQETLRRNVFVVVVERDIALLQFLYSLEETRTKLVHKIVEKAVCEFLPIFGYSIAY